MSTEHPLSRITLNGATMGTRYSALFHAPQKEGHATLGCVLHEAISSVDAVMSNWKADSDISRLNRAEPGQWIDLPESLIAVLETALAIEKQSNGAFDIGIADAVAAWGFGPDAGKLPSFPNKSRPKTRDHLELDRVNRQARKHTPLRLDLSGIAKGYGVDILGETLRAEGISDWLVGIDGEMRANGLKPDGTPWVIGLEKPVRGHREIDGVIELTDLAVATSGTYRHTRDIDGKTVSHTMDPVSDQPISGSLASVTVLASTCMKADAWATAILVDGHWPPKRFAAPDSIEAIVTKSEDAPLVAPGSGRKSFDLLR